MTKKKLAIVSPHHWSGGYGGAEYQISLLIGELAKNHSNLDLHYLCKPSKDHITPIDHTIHELSTQKWYSKYGSFFDSMSLLATLKAIQPDYIYQRVGCAYTGVCAYYAKKHHIPMLWHIASDIDVSSSPQPLLPKKPHHWLEKKNLEYGVRHSSRIVAQKQIQADLLKNHYHRDVDAIIANFQPLPKFVKQQTQSIEVVWISNHKQEKNPQFFIDLAEKLHPETGATFTMAGRADDSPWGQKIIERAVKRSCINFIGEQSQEEINLLLERSHLMVNTSDYEGFPNTFIQAWMREVPVISLHVDPNQLDKKGIGVICNTVENLYSQTKNLIEDKSLRLQMAKTSREYATNVHSLKNAEDVIQLLTKELE